MQYAIETLKIELYKIKETLRVARKNEHLIMGPITTDNEFEREAELHKAIAHLQSAEQGESPATDRQHTQHAIAALRSALSTLPVNLGMVDQIIVAFESELQQHASA